MPRLGSADDEDIDALRHNVHRIANENDFITGRHHIATAYAHKDGKFWIRVCLFVLISIFVVRNILFHDYREEAIETLQASGQSFDEIERIIPRTAQEKRKYALNEQNDILKMKNDIAYLLQQVQELRELVGDQHQHDLTSRSRANNGTTFDKKSQLNVEAAKRQII